MTTTKATQAEQLLSQIQQKIAALNFEAKEFMQLALAGFYLQAGDADIEAAEPAVELLNQVVASTCEEIEVELDATDKEIISAIANYLRQEPDTLKAIREIESISDHLADEIEG